MRIANSFNDAGFHRVVKKLLQRYLLINVVNEQEKQLHWGFFFFPVCECVWWFFVLFCFLPLADV